MMTSKKLGLTASMVVAVAALLAACAGEKDSAEPAAEQGSAQVQVSGLVAGAIQSMVVTAQPANVSKTLTYNQDAGTFNGLLVLPVGQQTLTANGYGYQADAGVVASGSATVNIQSGVTTAVTLRIYDQTPQNPQQDILPMIRSVTASKAQVITNEPITVTMDAVDLDGDPLTYAWASDCGVGTFSNASAATTTWRSNVPASCKLTATVTSKGFSLSESVDVLVFSAPPDGGPGEGGAQVNGEYVGRPEVNLIRVTRIDYFMDIYRGNFNANLPNMRPGQTYNIEVGIYFGSTFGAPVTSGLQVDCGGTLTLVTDTCANGGFCGLYYEWTTPASGTACKLTGSATNGSLRDTFSVGVLVK